MFEGSSSFHVGKQDYLDFKVKFFRRFVWELIIDFRIEVTYFVGLPIGSSVNLFFF